jgi:hypothetical protein
MTDAARFEPCDMTAPRKDQTAPLANRPRRESAAHVSRIDLAARSHDLISVGIKSKMPVSQSQRRAAWGPAKSIAPRAQVER